MKNKKRQSGISSKILTLLIFLAVCVSGISQTANNDYFDKYSSPSTLGVYDALDNDEYFLISKSIIYTTNNAEITGWLGSLLEYKPVSGFTGVDSLQYEICAWPSYTGGCSTAWVYFNVIKENNVTSVYPGDADNNGVVDNADLLPIGLHYEAQGFQRVIQGISFLPMPASDWYLDGDNGKFIDCDGSGLINHQDTLAIHQNYNSSTNKIWSNKATASDPTVSIYWEEDTLIAGEEAHLILAFGSDSVPAEDVYGFAIDIEYDLSYVERGSARANFRNTWLSYDGNFIKMARDDSAGTVELGFSRTDQVAKSGYGPVAKIRFIIEDNVNGKDLREAMVKAVIAYPKVIDSNGEDKALNIENASAPIANKRGEVIEDIIYGSQAVLAPNPANDFVNIQTTEGREIQDVEVFTATGELVKVVSVNNQIHIKLSVSDLTNNLYFIRIYTTSGVYTKKLMLNR